MKKWIVTAAIFALACTTLSFAEAKLPLATSAPQQPQDKPPIERPLVQPPVKPPVKPAPDAEKIAQHRANIARIAAKYSPDLLKRFKAAWREIDGLRKDIDLVIKALRSEKQDALKARIESIKADIIAGKLTKAEGNARIEAIKAAIAPNQGVIKSTLDILKVEYGLSDQQAKRVYQSLKEALEAKDEVAVTKVLKLLLSQLGKRIEFLTDKLSYIEKL